MICKGALWHYIRKRSGPFVYGTEVRELTSVVLSGLVSFLHRLRHGPAQPGRP